MTALAPADGARSAAEITGSLVSRCDLEWRSLIALVETALLELERPVWAEFVPALDTPMPLAIPGAEPLQHYGTVNRLPIALATSVCVASAESLNQLLADTMTLRDVSGLEPTEPPGSDAICRVERDGS